MRCRPLLALLVAAALGLPAAAAGKGKGRRPKKRKVERVVVSGDSLWAIAGEYGCRVAELQAANDLTGTTLHPGDRLVIPKCEPRSSRRGGGPFTIGESRIDKKTLPRLLSKHGFSRPEKFKALVVKMEIRGRGRTRRVVHQQVFDVGGTGTTWDDWNPASTVKLFSAIGAMEVTHRYGAAPWSTAQFGGMGRRRLKLDDLVRDALVDSSNLAHDYLVLLAGYDRLNGNVLGKGRGIRHSAVHRAYAESKWKKRGGKRSLKDSPKITLRRGKWKRTIPARKGRGDYVCPHHAACTSLADLAEAMRRLLLHEELPSWQRYKIGQREWVTLVRALKAKKKRTSGVVRELRRAYARKKREIITYSKAGFSGEWFSDCVYVIERGRRRRWIVALAGYPGRDAVDSAARAIGKILAAGEL